VTKIFRVFNVITSATLALWSIVDPSIVTPLGYALGWGTLAIIGIIALIKEILEESE